MKMERNEDRYIGYLPRGVWKGNEALGSFLSYEIYVKCFTKDENERREAMMTNGFYVENLH